MSWQDCARIVEAGDPWRFRTAMAAPRDARRILFPLYAFNVEVSRAPWVTQEAMIAEMRLQWWRDALSEIAGGDAVRRHEVASPLADLLSAQDATRLDETVAARRWDIYRDAFDDADHFDAYIDQTAGHLMWTADCLLGGEDENGTRALARASGIALFLRAIPKLEAAGRVPLIDGRASGIKTLAERGLAAFASRPKRLSPAHWVAAGAARTLRSAAASPERVASGTLAQPGPFALIKAAQLGLL